MDEYEKQAQDFLNKYNIKFSIVLVQNNKKQYAYYHELNHWGGNSYKVTLKKNKPNKICSFAFWGSIQDMLDDVVPNAYDVLACLSCDVHIDSESEYYLNFGHDGTPEKQIKEIATFGKKLKKFFTEQEIEDLSKIR